MKLIAGNISSDSMATCGYLCPSCEGREFMEDGTSCTWCKPLLIEKKEEFITDEEWLNSVHFGDCCSDRVEQEMKPLPEEKQ